MQRDPDSGDGGPGGPSRPAAVAPGSVRVLPAGTRTRVVLAGEIDAEIGPELIEVAAVAEQAGLPVVVDVSQVRFMDSTGVAFLARLASRSPGRLVLVRPPELVRFLIEVTSIREVLDVVDEEPATAPGERHPDGDDPDLSA